jgi:predicted metal-binding membrane protein
VSEPSGAGAGQGERAARDPLVLATGVALLVVAAVAWWGVLRQAAAMGGGMAEPMGEAGMGPSPLGGVIAFVAAWAVMMAAMMLPSAAPMVALYGAIRRGSGDGGQPGISTALFALTYLAVWAAVGLPVYAATLAVGALAAGSMAAADALPYALALVLVAAGLYQLTPAKAVCLRACRSPVGFLMGHWRAGRAGSLRLGLAHAAYCVGCCWALMVVLVAAGAMGLAWVLLIAVAVAAEKLLPGGEWTARAIGVVLVALGLLVAVDPGLALTLRGGAM